MVIDAAAILAILTRQDGADALVAALDAAPDPILVPTSSVFGAVVGLARGRGEAGAIGLDAETLGRARAAVAAFLDAVGAREVALSPEAGRRAFEHAAAGADAERCFALACAAGYRTRLLSA